MYSSTRSGDWRYGCASRARLKRWLAASVEEKFIRASIDEVEIQSGPVPQPLTSGGSYSCWPMLVSGVIAVLTEKPVQPISLMARTTYSTGHE